MLEFIQSKLQNKGKIYEYSNKKESHLAIFKKSDLNWLIENIFNNNTLLTKGQLIRYEQLKIGVMNDLTRLDLAENFHRILVTDEIIKTARSALVYLRFI